MVARDIACIAAPFEAVASRRAESQRDHRALHGKSKLAPIEFDLRGEIDIVLAARRDKLASLSAEELRGAGESETRKCIEQGQIGARLR